MLGFLFYLFLGLLAAGIIGLTTLCLYHFVKWIASNWRRSSWGTRIRDILLASLIFGGIGFFVVATIIVSITN